MTLPQPSEMAAVFAVVRGDNLAKPNISAYIQNKKTGVSRWRFFRMRFGSGSRGRDSGKSPWRLLHQ